MVGVTGSIPVAPTIFPLLVKASIAAALPNDGAARSGAMNAINIIAPYKHLGMWVFDDPRVGLVQEPFVSGADTMIDRVVAAIPEAEKGFIMVFSGVPFPGHQFRLEWRRADAGGNWYYAADLDLEGWLCPALLKYFPEAPKDIFVQVKRHDAKR
jgi:hypothetical protein